MLRTLRRLITFIPLLMLSTMSKPKNAVKGPSTLAHAITKNSITNNPVTSLPTIARKKPELASSMTCADDTMLSSSSSALIKDAAERPFERKSAKDVHVPVGRDGEGEYTAATKGCFDVIDAATPNVLNQVRAMIRKCDTADAYERPFHVADFGSADAGTSLGLLTKVIRTVREYSDKNSRHKKKKREVVLHYEDQLMNEWKSVFNHALGNKKVTDAYGINIDVPFEEGNVYVEACGVGFHQQCYPSGSIDLGISFTAMHWLSTNPSTLKGTTEAMHAARLAHGTSTSNSDEVHKQNLGVEEKIQAEKDWLAILHARSNELKTGGKFVTANFCVSDQGYFLGQTDKGASMWDSFLASWNELYYADKLINEEERLGVSFPNYYRTTDEFIQGVEQIPHLKLISAEEKIVRCPYREQYTNSGNTKTPEEYAKLFVPVCNVYFIFVAAHSVKKKIQSLSHTFFHVLPTLHLYFERRQELGLIQLLRLLWTVIEVMMKKSLSWKSFGRTMKT